MNSLSRLLSTFHTRPADTPAIDPTPAARTTSQVCIDLVWQALAGAKTVARQMTHHLCCRQHVPDDTLDAPSGHGLSYGSGADTQEDVQAVAAAGADPVTPPASSERPAEEQPYDAPPSPRAPSPLKSVLRSPGDAKRRSHVRFDDGQGPLQHTTATADETRTVIRVRPLSGLFTELDLPASTALLDFRISGLSTARAAVNRFTAQVKPHACSLASSAQAWLNIRLSVSERLDILRDAQRELKALTELTEAFMKDLSSGQAGRISQGDAHHLLDMLEDKLLDLRANQARVNGQIEGQEAMQRAGVENVCDVPDEASVAEESDDESSSCSGLDFDGLDAFDHGDTAAVVATMRGPVFDLLEQISDLEDQFVRADQAPADRQRAAQGIVDGLGRLNRLLSLHISTCGGHAGGFKDWLQGKKEAVQLELGEWQGVLDHIDG